MEILLPFLSAILWGLGDFLIKKSTQKMDAFQYLWIANLSGILFLPFALNIDLRYIHKLLTLGILYFISTFSLFKALSKSPVSIVMPMAGAFMLVAVLLGIVLDGEPTTAFLILGTLLIFFGNGLITYKPSVESLRNDSLLWTLSFIIFNGIATYYAKKVSAYYSPLEVAFFVSSIYIIMLLPKIWGKMPKKGRATAFTAGFSMNLALAVFVWSLSKIPVSIATPISSLSILVAFLLGIFVGKERLTQNEIIGALMDILGVVMVAFSKPS